MVFNNYQIPKEITKEEEFTYNLKEKLYWTNSASGLVLGGLFGLIEKMKEMGVTSD